MLPLYAATLSARARCLFFAMRRYDARFERYFIAVVAQSFQQRRVAAYDARSAGRSVFTGSRCCHVALVSVTFVDYP